MVAVRTITTECDRAVTGLLEDFLNGNTTSSEEEVRAKIAERLLRVGIASEVARESTQNWGQGTHDVAEELERLMVDKIMQRTPGGYDLQRGLEASATGWARQLLRAARRSVHRNVVNRGLARAVPVDPTANYLTEAQPRAHRVFHTAASPGVPVPAPEPDRDAIEDAEAWFTRRSRNLRDASRVAAQAATLRYAYGLPELIRPRLPERSRLQGLLAADRSLAHASIKAMHALVNGETYPTDIDRGLLGLWDEFSIDHMEVVAEAPSRVAETLIDAALADRARPSRGTLSSFRARIRSAGTGTGWRRIADNLADAYVALEFEAYSAFDSAASEFRQERTAGRAIQCRRSPEAFAAAVAYPSQSLGMTEDQVYEALSRIAGELTEPVISAEAGQVAA